MPLRRTLEEDLPQLEDLRAAMKTRPPFCTGVVTAADRDLLLFYGKDKEASRLDFTTASTEDLEHLTRVCEPATFGLNHEDVLDENYRKAGKLDYAHFAVSLDLQELGLLRIVGDRLLGTHHDAGVTLRAERYKINVYGKDAFFKSHKDTPRSQEMFGSLVLIFPTEHEGGALILRDGGEEFVFDSAKAVCEHGGPCIGYAAFYSDIEHEVAVVSSGYRVTLTYNLYHHTTPISPTDSSLPFVNTNLKNSVQALLEDASFLPEGGYVGFGLHHEYPLPRDNKTKIELSPFKDRLKGIDAELMTIAHELSLDATVYLWFANKKYRKIRRAYFESNTLFQGVVCGFIPDVDGQTLEYSFAAYLCEQGGKRVGNMREAIETRDAALKGHRSRLSDKAESPLPIDMEVCWVTVPNDHAAHKLAYMVFGNEASLEFAYGKLCLIIKVGAHGERKTV